MSEARVDGDALSVELIRRRLHGDVFASHIYLFDEVSSTNDVLRRLAREGAREGTVVIADAQRAARGRLGTPWFAPPLVNLYLSVLLRPALTIRAVPTFSHVASLALAETLWLQGIPAVIQWPNDVLLDGKKVAGILVDCSADGGRVAHVILGVGVNVNVTRRALDAGLGGASTYATSLCEVAGRELDRNELAAVFLNLLAKWLQVYQTSGPQAVLAAWRAHETLAGHRVTIRDRGVTGIGRVLGVNRNGELVVAKAGGGIQVLVAGQVRRAG